MVLVDEYEREASSANTRAKLSRSSAISLMYNKKRKKPRTNPCGTPACIEPSLETVFLSNITCLRLFK